MCYYTLKKIKHKSRHTITRPHLTVFIDIIIYSRMISYYFKRYMLLTMSVLALYLAGIAYASGNWQLIGPGDADQTTSLTILKNETVVAGFDIGGLYISENNGNSWQHVNRGLENLDITTKIIQGDDRPEILFVGTRGGIYKSDNYGKYWIRLEGGLPAVKNHALSGSIGGIAIDPYNNNTLYAGLGYRPSSDGSATVRKLQWSRYIYKSTNGGDRWDKKLAFPAPSKVTQLLHSPAEKDTIFASTSTGLYVSKDAGNTWHRILDKETLTIAIDRKNPKLIYAACGEEGAFKSTDGGKVWKAINNGLGFFNISRSFTNRYSVISISPGNSNTVYLVNSTWGRSGGLYKSTDSGKNWHLLTETMPESWLKTSRRMNDIAISTINDNQIYLGSSRYIYASSDGGRTWSQKISTKTGSGWTHTGLNVFGQTRVIAPHHSNSNILFIGTADHKMLRSNDKGKSWTPLLQNDQDANYVWDISSCKAKPEILNIVTSSNKGKICFMKSDNNGKTWFKNCAFKDTASWKEKILVDLNNCNNILLSTYHNIYQSKDGGENWKSILPENSDIKIRSLEKTISGNRLIGTTSGLYIINAGQHHWNHIENTRDMKITSIYIHPDNTEEIYIGTELSRKRPAEVYKSTDGGRNWIKIAGNLRRYVSAITSLPADRDVLYFTTLDDNYHDISKGAGIFRSTNRGKIWRRIDESLPVFRAYNAATTSLAPNLVYIATNGSGVYVRDESEIINKTPSLHKQHEN